ARCATPYSFGDTSVERQRRWIWSILHITIGSEAILRRYHIIFTTPPDKIAVVFQGFQQHRLIGLEHVEHRAMTAHMWIPAGHERATTRRANGILAICLAKRDRICFYPLIKRRRNSRSIPHMTKYITAPLIRVKDHNMRSFSHQSLFAF